MEFDAYSEEFEIWGKEILNKCGGLPLAIVVLEGLLATKESLNEWEMVRDNINVYSNKLQQEDYHYGGVKGILALSYNELPFHLKPCFLYLSQYPEDLEISKKELIRLWIPEGFVSKSNQKETYMEDIAEQYFKELLNRCLVHVGRRDHTGKGVKTFRIYDLLMDLCVSKAQEKNFLGIIRPPKNEERYCSVDLNFVAARRVAIHAIHLPEFQKFSLVGKCSNLRSLLLFPGERWINQKISFRFLRVLKLWTSYSFPNEIGDLIHLRYFALCCAETNLPRSLVNLKSLHTLTIQFTTSRLFSIKVPNVVFKLKRLRHLIVSSLYPWKGDDWVTLKKLQVLDTNLESVETLKYIKIKNLIEMKVLLKLSKIRRLGIQFERSEDVETFINSLNLGHLQSLSLSLGRVVPFPNLEPLSHCHHLSKLFLIGEIPQLSPHQHALKFLPKYISKLTLWFSRMEHDPMVVLENLPQLRSLHLLENAYKGTKLYCSANGFPLLNNLHMRWIYDLEDWEIEEGAMPRLEVLELHMVGKLHRVEICDYSPRTEAVFEQ